MPSTDGVVIILNLLKNLHINILLFAVGHFYIRFHQTQRKLPPLELSDQIRTKFGRNHHTGRIC